MIRRDRFLLSILAGIILLVVLALALYFSRQGALAYGPEDTPQGVIHNYLVAITLKDYQRAFQDVAGPPATTDPNQTPGLPNAALFRQFFVTEIPNQLANTGLQIGDASISGDLAIVQVTVVHTSGSLFNSVGREAQQFQLFLQNGAWKIIQGPYPYWNYSWTTNLPVAKPVPARPSNP
jgi:hypothetical protein